MNNQTQEPIIAKMIADRKIRKAITTEDLRYFFGCYYAHYVKYPTASFQKEIINLLQENKEDLYIVAFRGSAKSTIVTTAYPIWAILGKQQKKFCIILCQTKTQAKQHMMNIRMELENNDLLKKDLGPFQEESDEWGSYSLVFKKHKARITVASTEQSIRGIRHNEHRPDLIICDDVEDLQSTKTRESRDKTYQWLRGEVIPTGDKTTRLIIVGNLLHEDSLLMKIKKEISQGKTTGIFKEYPLLDSNGACLWPEKYPTKEDIHIEKQKVSSEVSWQREFLLKIIPDEDQVILPDWIQYYDTVPNKRTDTLKYDFTLAGVDLAISEKDSADYTGVVTVQAYRKGDERKLYILPSIINKRISFPEQRELLKNLYATFPYGYDNGIVVESVGYQEALAQSLREVGIKDVYSVPIKLDKRSRLTLTSSAIKDGTILFPKFGCEALIEQLVGFGAEKHDDLADAFSIGILKALELSKKCEVVFG
jgi:phage terminase large subunit-like protein